MRGSDNLFSQPNIQEQAYDQKADEFLQMYAILTYLVDKLKIIGTKSLAVTR